MLTMTAALVLSTSTLTGAADAKCEECFTSLITGDLNCDQCVDSADLAILLAAWGTSCHDLNLDGVVDDDDLAILMANWGC